MSANLPETLLVFLKEICPPAVESFQFIDPTPSDNTYDRIETNQLLNF